MAKEIRRRRFLGVVGGVGLAGLAGCTSDSGNDGSDSNGSGNGQNNTGRNGSENTTENKKRDKKNVVPEWEKHEGWPMYQHDLWKSGYNPHTDGPKKLDPKWEFKTGEKLDGEYSNYLTLDVAVAESELYVSYVDLYALDANTGEQKWKLELESEWTNPLVVANDTIYTATRPPRKTGKTHIHAIDRNTRETKWKKDISGDRPVDGILVGDSTIFITGGRKVIGLDSGTGEEAEFGGFETDKNDLYDGYMVSVPVLKKDTEYGDLLYLLTGTKLYCVDANSGNKYWNHSTSRNIYGGISADQDIVFVVGKRQGTPATDGGSRYISDVVGKNTFAFDALTGEKLWSNTKFGGRMGTAVDDRNVYVFDSSGKIIPIDKSTGSSKTWLSEDVNAGVDTPAVTSEVVYIATDGVYAIDKSTGKTLDSFDLEHDSTGDPIVANGNVYVRVKENKIHTLSD